MFIVFSDINECEVNNGGCGQICMNMPGSFACNCEPEHYLAIDGQTCVPFNPDPPPPSPPTTTTTTPSPLLTTSPPTTSSPPTTTSTLPLTTSIPPTSPSSTSTTATATATHTTPPASEEHPTVAGPLCGGDLKTANGMFQTLNWPQTYPVNVDCEWNIEIPDTTKVIEISFDRSVFGIAGSLPNCIKDWVKVYDGNEVSETFWGPFCHYRVPDTIKTSSYQAKVHFHAGPVHNSARRGFKASYVSVDGADQGPVEQVIPQNPTGELTSNF